MTVTRYIGVSLSLAVTLCLGAAAAEPNAGASAGSGDGANVVPPAAAFRPAKPRRPSPTAMRSRYGSVRHGTTL